MHHHNRQNSRHITTKPPVHHPAGVRVFGPPPSRCLGGRVARRGCRGLVGAAPSFAHSEYEYVRGVACRTPFVKCRRPTQSAGSGGAASTHVGDSGRSSSSRRRSFARERGFECKQQRRWRWFGNQPSSGRHHTKSSPATRTAAAEQHIADVEFVAEQHRGFGTVADSGAVQRQCQQRYTVRCAFANR